MAEATEFSELRRFLADWLPSMPRHSDRLLKEFGAQLLYGSPGMPTLFMLGPVSLDWRLQGSRVSGAWRFLFWSAAGNRLETVDARLQVALTPGPILPDGAPEAPPPVVRLYFPRLIAGQLEPDEFARLAWPGADERRTIVLRLNEGVTISCWNTGGDDVPIGGVFSRVIHGDLRLDLGSQAAWPVEVLFAIARGLRDPAAARRGDRMPFEQFQARSEIWTTVGELVGLAGEMQGLLDAAPRLELDERFRALQARWQVGEVDFQAGFFVSPEGEIGPANPEDGLKVPIRLVLEKSPAETDLALDIGPPEIALRGELRAAMLQAIVEESGGDFDDYAESIADETGDSELTGDEVRRWCASDWSDAMVLLVDQRKKGKGNEYMLVTSAQIKGRLVAVMIHADAVDVSYDASWKIDVDSTDLVFAGVVDGRPLKWKKHAERFMDILSILIRWRALFR